MRLKELHTAFQQELYLLYDSEEINSFFFILTEEFFSINRLNLALRPDVEITEKQAEKLIAALADLKQEKPVQYITGKAYFFDLEFEVNEFTLIPRPETEELAEWILKDFTDKKDTIKILDVGTGSGCIAISLAANLKNANMYAVDISEGALETAYRNAQTNKVLVSFSKADVLKGLTISGIGEGELDMLVSNPPYVRELEKGEMRNNVLKYEPDSALFVPDNNPLLFYEKIAKEAMRLLKPTGALYYEINQYLAEETKELVSNIGFTDMELKKDIYGNYRMLKAVKPL